MRIHFFDIAQIELDQAIEYYNYESPELGDEFPTEVLKALDRIGKFPEAWHRCRNEPGDVKHDGSLTESFIKSGRTKFWWLQSLTCTGAPITGKTDL